MTPEKMPPFKRPEPIIVGDASSKMKEGAKKLIIERFGENHCKDMPESLKGIIESFEIPKKPSEIETIKISNEITNNLLKEFGLPQFDIPERNIHILPEAAYKRMFYNEYGAATFDNPQMILVNNDKEVHSMARSSEIFHEMVHLKGYLALELDKKSLSGYRSGLIIYPTRLKIANNKNAKYMTGLNEAIVTEIEKRYSPQIFKKNKYLKKEYDFQKSEKIENLKKRNAEDYGVDPEDIEAIDEKNKLIYFYAYPEQRQVLHFIANSIHKENKEKFKSEEEVMKKFFRAHFTGNVLDIARLIENSFGKGSFRILGEMTHGDEGASAERVMNYLKSRISRRPRNEDGSKRQ